MTVLHELASANFGIVGLAAKDPTDCRLRGHVRIKFSEKCRQPGIRSRATARVMVPSSNYKVDVLELTQINNLIKYSVNSNCSVC